ncbi:MAG: type VI secretion system tube protein Hcp [bacterium]
MCLAALPAHAANEVFLKIPQVSGESQSPLHLGEIDVLAWSWGGNFVLSTNLAGRVGRVSMQELSLTKYLDKSSPVLIGRVCMGMSFGSASLMVRNAASTGEFYRVTLTNVIVESYSTGGWGGQDRMTENIALGYKAFKIDYICYPPGGLYSQRRSCSFDLVSTNGGALVDQPERLAPFVATLTCQAGSAQAHMAWHCIPGRQYQVLFTDDLNHSFSPLATYPAGATEVMSITVPASLAKGFFKVIELTE